MTIITISQLNALDHRFTTMNRKLNTRDLEELLESDDDLPDTYEEIPDVPSYQNDKRFDPLQFFSLEKTEWPALKNKCTQNNTSAAKVNKEVYEAKNVLVPKPEIKLRGPEKVTKKPNSESVLVNRGVLSQPDLYCLKALVSMSTDVDVMWFVNFLMRKDMQDKYKFLKSCLIEDLEKKTPTISRKRPKSKVNKFKYELNIL